MVQYFGYDWKFRHYRCDNDVISALGPLSMKADDAENTQRFQIMQKWKDKTGNEKDGVSIFSQKLRPVTAFFIFRNIF